MTDDTRNQAAAGSENQVMRHQVRCNFVLWHGLAFKISSVFQIYDMWYKLWKVQPLVCYTLAPKPRPVLISLYGPLKSERKATVVSQSRERPRAKKEATKLNEKTNKCPVWGWATVTLHTSRYCRQKNDLCRSSSSACVIDVCQPYVMSGQGWDPLTL